MKISRRAFVSLFAVYAATVFGAGILAKGGYLPWQLYPATPASFANLFFPQRYEAQEFKPTFVYLGGPQRVPTMVPEIDLDLRKLWSSPPINLGVHSASKASPAVDDSGIYVGGDDGTFRAFEHDGRQRWSFRTGGQTMGIHGTALLDEHYAYFGSYNGRLYCVRKSDGRLVWTTKLANAVGSSPAYAESDLIVSAETEGPRNGFLVRVDSRSGAVLWQSEPFGEQVHSSPTISADQQRAYVGDNAGNFQAFSTLNGHRLWSLRLGLPMKGTAALKDGTLYFTSWDAKFWAVDEVTGQVRWTLPLRTKSQSSTVIAGDIALVGSHSPSRLYGIDLRQKKILWEKPIEGKATGISTGRLVKIKKRAGEYFAAYCGTGEGFCILEPRTGRVLKKIPQENFFTGVITTWRDRIYVSMNRGPLTVYGPPTSVLPVGRERSAAPR